MISEYFEVVPFQIISQNVTVLKSRVFELSNIVTIREEIRS